MISMMENRKSSTESELVQVGSCSSCECDVSAKENKESTTVMKKHSPIGMRCSMLWPDVEYVRNVTCVSDGGLN